jgi:hypothetical protein
LDRNDIKLDLNFFNIEYENLSRDIYERSSMEGWLKCLFLEKESNFWIKGID